MQSGGMGSFTEGGGHVSQRWSLAKTEEQGKPCGCGRERGWAEAAAWGSVLEVGGAREGDVGTRQTARGGFSSEEPTGIEAL